MKWRKPRNPALSQCDPNQLLGFDLLALDRMLVEVSMRIYNVPRRDRFSMRDTTGACTMSSESTCRGSSSVSHPVLACPGVAPLSFALRCFPPPLVR